MTALTPLAIQNLPILRRLAAGPKPESVGALAVDVARDTENLRKTLKLMRAGDLVGEDLLELTDPGRQVVAVMDRAERGDALPEGAVAVPYEFLRANPLNPRKSMDQEELAELTQSIAEAGLLQPLLVTPADAFGGRLILAGHRRWLAIANCIADGSWPADKLIPCMEHAPDASVLAQATFIGLVENGRRTGLSWLEEARAYQDLVASTRWSAAEAARRTGKNARVVQEMLKVLAEATVDDLAAHARGEISAEELRYRVRTPDPDKAKPKDDFARQVAAATTQEVEDLIGREADLSAHEALVLVEIQAAAAVRPVKSELGPCAQIDEDVKLSEWPPEKELASRGYIAIRSGYQGNVTLLRPAQAYLDRLIFKLATPAERLRRARENAGIDDAQIAKLEAAEEYDRSWLNERNAPKKLTPAEALVLLELTEIGGAYPGAEVSADYDRGVVGGLKERGLIDGPRIHRHRTYLSVSWQGQKALERAYPDHAQRKARRAHLATVREALGVTPQDAARFVTPWLNGPFDLPADVAELQAKAAAEDKAREDRANQLREAKVALKAKRGAALAALEAEVASLSTEDRISRFNEILQLLNGPAPWKAADRSYWEIATAGNGHRIDSSADVCKRLMVLAVNIAAGVDLAQLDTPPPLPSRQVFEGWIADRMVELLGDLERTLAELHAKAALDSYLDAEGVAFGDDDFNWTSAEAVDTADCWMEDVDVTQPPPAVAEDDAADAEPELAEA